MGGLRRLLSSWLTDRRDLELGSLASYREQAREAGRSNRLDDLRQDLRYAARSFARRPAFAITFIFTVGLAIGVTTTVFSAVNAIVLRPLPFPDSSSLVALRGTSPTFPEGEALNHLDVYRDESTTLEGLAGYDVGAQFLAGDAPTRVVAVRTEPAFFAVLGTPALRGRTYAGGEPDSAVALLAEPFWTRQFDRDPAILGRTIVLNGRPHTVVGVMPESFRYPYGAASLLPGVATEAPADVWIPFPEPPARLGSVVARLKPGVSLDAAAADLRAVAARLADVFPQTNSGRSVRLEPLSAAVVSSAVRRVVSILFMAAGLVLALACATLANLALVHARSLGRELAVRRALGAGRERLARQFIAESALLALAGGAGGLLLAFWSARRLSALAAARLPRAAELTFDWRVFGFAAAVGLLVTVLSALASLAAAGWADGRTAAGRSIGRSTMGRGSRRLRDSLVVLQIALACVLAIGAAMLVRELDRLRALDPGMQTRDVLTLHISYPVVLGRGPRPDERQTRQYYEIADRAAALPGVAAAGFTQLLPLQNWGWTSTSGDFRPAGHRPPGDFAISMRYVTPGYFDALGIPVRAGRAFDARDTVDAPAVVMINEALARLYFPERSPVDVPTNRGTIVGIAGDVREARLGQPASPELYFPIVQNWSQLSELGMTLVVRTDGTPSAGPLADAIRAIVREVNPAQAVFNVRTMEQVVDESLADLVLSLSLVLLFAGAALVLAAVGTYGVIAYVAAARTREFAVRVALGATPARLMRGVLHDGLMLAVSGVALGVGLSVAATPLTARLPVDIGSFSFSTIGPVVVGILLTTLAACLLPARRAARVDPMAALRCE